MAESKPTELTPVEKKAADTSADLRQFYKMGVEAREGAGNYRGKE